MSSLIISGDTSGTVIIAAPAVAGSGTLTLPTGTDTLVGLAATQTLTNKTLTSPVISSLSSATATALTLQSAGTTAVTIDTAGQINLPLQPSFLAVGSGSNQTIATTVTSTVQMGTEIFDQNGDYNPTTFTFTAPVTGRYLLTASVRIDGVAAAGYAILVIVTSNRQVQTILYTGAASSYQSHTLSVIADMDASDTAVVRVNSDGQTITLPLTQPTYYSFSGQLLA